MPGDVLVDWPLDPKLTRDYIDDEIHPIVSKLVVNTTDHVPLECLYNAVSDLTTDSEGSKADLEEWMSIGDFNGVHLEGKRELTRLMFDYCSKGHLIREYWEEGIDYESNCGVCENKVTESQIYACSSCLLAIHKSCAELGAMEFTPSNFPKFLIRNDDESSESATYCFPENHSCFNCRDDDKGKGFSSKCESCTFLSHLKSCLLATILNHPDHEHKLYFWLNNVMWDGPCGFNSDSGLEVGCSISPNGKANFFPNLVLVPSIENEELKPINFFDEAEKICWW